MSNKRCLIVDDSDVVRRVTRHMFSAMGFDAAEASDGREALNHCETVMPDAILLDWIMPVMSGVPCLRAIRRLPGGDQPAVIYCTSENDPDEIARAMIAGADAVIVKPFDRAELRSKLAKLGLID